MSRIILVTGASSGIGLAIARFLSEKGETVLGTSRGANHGDKLEKFSLVQMDITKEDSVKSAVQFILQKHGRLDVVVNNAGTGFNGAVEDVTNDEVLSNFNLNVLGAWNVCRAVLPVMKKQKSGYIINVSSVAGRTGLPFRSVYSSTKHALEAMSESLSMEVKRWGINVCIVEPSEFRTSIIENRGSASQVSNDYKHDFDRIVEQINRGVSDSPEPVAMGECIYNIINNPKPKLRYVVANRTARLSILLKKILPGRMYERLVMKHYGMKSQK